MNYLRHIELEKSDQEAVFQIQKLLMDMGNKFKVLIQQKELKSKMLTGTQFSIPLEG
jgi:SAM-dependent MidA family methyltransferase